jgi:hypothetical protein
MRSNSLKPVVAATVMSITLAACSDIYYDRRDAIHISHGNANASNIAVQTIVAALCREPEHPDERRQNPAGDPALQGRQSDPAEGAGHELGRILGKPYG